MTDPFAPRQYDLTLQDPLGQSPVVRLVNLILTEALGASASAIRLLASPDSCVVEYQADGEWRRVMKIPGAAGMPVVNRLKLMADLEPTTQRRPHQGEIHAIVDGTPILLKVEAASEPDGSHRVTVLCTSTSSHR